MKIVILDGQTTNPGDLSWAPLERLGKLKVYERSSEEQILLHAEAAEVVLTNKTPLNRETIRKLTALRYIGVLATGHNVVNVPAAAKRGVVVTNVPDYCTASVAEHVFALLLELARNADHHAYTVRKGRWCRHPDFCYWLEPLAELAGRTLGIVGFGHTGRAVARRALAFDMKVLVHTRTPPSPVPPGVELASLERVFAESDAVSLHVPLQPDTEQLVNAERLALMKPAAWLINTSRGGVVDEAALAAALRQKKIAAAALDVLSQEPPLDDHPLLRLPNCLITPHQAWASREARTRLIQTAAANLEAFLAGHPQNVVLP